ncbi:MAG: type I pullulanase, partial [Anaeroplasmataceae bacterium]|nr:type I pullulanase [Anaeroplasmataceae bacterium]
TMMAFIDTYNEITFLVQRKNRFKAKSFYLYDEDLFVEELKVNYSNSEHNMVKISLRVNTKLILHHNYFIVDDLKHHVPVYSGSIVRTSEFESKYFYDGKLGFEYTKEATTFRVWSPVAKSIYVSICYKDGSLDRKDLNYQNHGVWVATVDGDLEGASYVYYVKIFDYYEKVLDPYGLSAGENREYNYVIDLNKLYKIEHEKPFYSGHPVDAVIYEANVRDMTGHLNNELKGTFLGLVDEDENKGLNYISSLGVTHLQLMPVFDFGGVDDKKRDLYYNWGYNPEQYFVPSGWYSFNPKDPYSRLNEYLRLIDEAHKRGMRVVMDVVFNHVYDRKNFPFEKLVPGYFYRVDAYGNYTNVSGCGNDLATEKRMCSRFIVDNLVYWAKFFQISGFRFDLMGLLDIETLKFAYQKLKEIDTNILLYGEGWNMPNTIPDAYRPHTYNAYKMPQYGFFNDKYRDTLKGSQWNHSLGYAFGHPASPKEIFHLMGGSILDGYRFQNPNQSINYVECHDNYTLYDFAIYGTGASEEVAIRGGRVALQMIAVSLGMVFIHAGQEFYRTKRGVENSYKSEGSINRFDYARRNRFQEDIEGIKDLLRIRRYYPEFRMQNPCDIERKMIFIEELSNENRVCYCLDGTEYRLTIVVKNTTDSYTFILNHSAMIFDGHKASSIKQDSYILEDAGIFIFKEMK